MPHIAVSLYPGRDAATKREIAEKTERWFSSEFAFGEKEVSISIVEIEPDAFVPTVLERYGPSELLVPSRYIPTIEAAS